MFAYFKSFEFYFVITLPDFVRKLEALAFIADKFDLKLNAMFSFIDLMKHPQDLEYLEELKASDLINKTMLDSSAFLVLGNVLNLHQYLHLTRKTYVKFAETYSDLFDYIVAPDVPCSVSEIKLPNEERIKLTVENTIEFLSNFSERKKVIAVVQGYKPKDYETCCRLYKEKGIQTRKIGIGSLRLYRYTKKNINTILQIINTVKRNFVSSKIHAFGLNMHFLSVTEIVNDISSTDSATWVIVYSRFNRLRLYDPYKDSLIELDLTRNGKKINEPQNIVYIWTILSFILRIDSLLRKARGAQQKSLFRVA